MNIEFTSADAAVAMVKPDILKVGQAMSFPLSGNIAIRLATNVYLKILKTGHSPEFGISSNSMGSDYGTLLPEGGTVTIKLGVE